MAGTKPVPEAVAQDLGPKMVEEGLGSGEPPPTAARAVSGRRVRAALATATLLAVVASVHHASGPGFRADGVQVAGAGEADSPALHWARRLSSSYILGATQGGQEGSDTDSIRHRNGYSAFVSVCVQIAFGALYFFIIVQKYPAFSGEPTDAARETQSKNEVVAFLTCENSCVITLTSWVCPAGRSAHTYDKVGLLPYWLGLVLSAVCPCGTLLYMNACTDLNEKLGGEKRGFLMAVLCSCFCPVCVIAQDATALDECTGAVVGLCSVEGGNEDSNGDSE